MSERIEAAFRALGLHGWLHAVDLDSGREVGLRADEPVVLASVFKVALVTALHRSGLDLTTRVEIHQRSPGATGVSAMQDPVTLSLRDLAYLALAVSDNAAADVLFDAVGDAPVTALLQDLGLSGTRIPHRCRDIARALVADAGVEDVQGWLEADPRRLGRLSVRDPARTNAGTPREMTTLLAALWADRAAAPEACAAIRRLMRLQVWPHRLASGFPGDAVAGKTGTLPGVRNEIGVVERADGARVAVAVFTRSDSPAASLPQADRVIGTAARIAADALRSPP
jgi:beta-lactamase class A